MLSSQAQVADLVMSARICVLVVGFINLFFSCLTLILIWVLHRRNHFDFANKGFQFLVLGMTLLQIVYDVTQTIQLECTTVSCGGGRLFLALFSGFSCAALADIIVFAAVFVVLKQEHVKIGAIRWATAAALVGGLIIASVCTTYKVQPDLPLYDESYVDYNILRSVEMVLALAGCLVILAVVFRLGFGGQKNNKQSVLKALAHRLIYYPLAMCLSRLGATVWIYHYHCNIGFTAQVLSTYPRRKMALLFGNIILTPSGGFLNFCIFCAVQPFAYAHLAHFVSRVMVAMGMGVMGGCAITPLPGCGGGAVAIDARIASKRQLQQAQEDQLISMLSERGDVGGERISWAGMSVNVNVITGDGEVGKQEGPEKESANTTEVRMPLHEAYPVLPANS